MNNTKPNKPNRNVGNRSSARTLAVQALYNSEMEDDANLREMMEQVMKLHESQDKAKPTDAKFLKKLLQGVVEKQDELDEKITPLLDKAWTMEKIGPLMRSILRLSFFEMYFVANVPARVVIKEYMKITEEFVGSNEVKFTNAILDKIAKEARKGEF